MHDTQDRQDPDAMAHAKPARRRLLVVLAVVAVIAVGAGAGVLLALRDADGGPAAAPEPVVLPVPTPTIEPVERARTTAFQQALPDTVLAFAVSAQDEAVDLLDAGAVEAHRLTYTDGVETVLLDASQWRSVEAAAAASTAAAGRGPVDDSDSLAPETIREGPVLVGGVEAGRVLITGDESAARAVWTNGATLFVLQGPAAAVEACYDAFPM